MMLRVNNRIAETERSRVLMSHLWPS